MTHFVIPPSAIIPLQRIYRRFDGRLATPAVPTPLLMGDQAVHHFMITTTKAQQLLLGALTRGRSPAEQHRDAGNKESDNEQAKQGIQRSLLSFRLGSLSSFDALVILVQQADKDDCYWNAAYDVRPSGRAHSRFSPVSL